MPRLIPRQAQADVVGTLDQNSLHASMAVGSSNPTRIGDLRPNRGRSVRSGDVLKANLVECPKLDIITRKALDVPICKKAATSATFKTLHDDPAGYWLFSALLL